MMIRYEEVEFKSYEKSVSSSEGRDEGGKQGKFIFDTDTRMLRVTIPGKKKVYDIPVESIARMVRAPEIKAEPKKVA